MPFQDHSKLDSRSFPEVETTATDVSVDRPLEGVSALGLELRVLGPFEAAIGGEVLDLGGPKQRAVLALLALRAPSGLSIDGVIDGIWGERAPNAARSSVWSYVSNLRALLGGGIEHRRGVYRLTTAATSDAVSFELDLDRARASMSVDPEEAGTILRHALASWRGLPYADLLEIPGLREEIRRLEELRLRAGPHGRWYRHWHAVSCVRTWTSERTRQM